MRELQKAEALKRMKALRLHENAIKEFDNKGKLNISKGYGSLYWLSDEEKTVIEEFEKESGNLVYHAIYSETEFGNLYTLLYVSKHEEEWGRDFEDIKHNTCCAYVKNITDDWCSEYGYICFRNRIGGLIRTA